MEAYITRRLIPGGFLQAVICNDLKEAFGRADEDNTRAMKEIVSWFYNEAPSDCWGSREKMEAWIRRT